MLHRAIVSSLSKWLVGEADGGAVLAALANFQISDDIDEEKSYLLHAHVACLLDGRDLGHIDDDAYRAFLDPIRDNLSSAGLIDSDELPTGALIRAEIMWNLFCDAVQQAADTMHPCGRPVALADTRDSSADYCRRDLVTIGPLEYQSGLAARGAMDLGRRHLMKLSKADILRKSGNRKAIAPVIECCNHALAKGMVAPSEFLKASPAAITWITPVKDAAARLLSRADAYGLVKRDITALRNLLGLWAENGKSKRPLAAFFLTCPTGLAAPNVFTAKGYERFRHRPASAGTVDANSGLTYNMDRTNAALDPGACEIVADEVTMPQIRRMEAGGRPARFMFGRKGELVSHRLYSEEVHGGRPIKTILADLEASVP